MEQVLQQERQLLSTALNSSHSVPEGGDTKVEEGRERGDSDMNLQVLHDQVKLPMHLGNAADSYSLPLAVSPSWPPATTKHSRQGVTAS